MYDTVCLIKWQIETTFDENKQYKPYIKVLN